jgi:hypothetical protein
VVIAFAEEQWRDELVLEDERDRRGPAVSAQRAGALDSSDREL